MRKHATKDIRNVAFVGHARVADDLRQIPDAIAAGFELALKL